MAVVAGCCREDIYIKLHVKTLTYTLDYDSNLLVSFQLKMFSLKLERKSLRKQPT